MSLQVEAAHNRALQAQRMDSEDHMGHAGGLSAQSEGPHNMVKDLHAVATIHPDTL